MRDTSTFDLRQACLWREYMTIAWNAVKAIVPRHQHNPIVSALTTKPNDIGSAGWWPDDEGSHPI